jgi:hypothetical protein
MNYFKYNVGDLVKMYDCQEHKIFFGYVTDLALDPKNNINMYEVYWFDEETSNYQPFSYHEEFSLQPHRGYDASIME